jgi:hypothetical protein
MPKTVKSRRTKKPAAVDHVWDQACELVVERTSPCGTYSGPIDPGVNYFVLALEQLGASPRYSCEGHPGGFYVLFEAPLALALRILNCGYFTVELEGKNLWSIRMRVPDTDDERVQLLRWAADAWTKYLGPLSVLP